MNLSEMQDAVWGYLGTKATDRAHTAAQVTRELNNALNELVQDTPPGFLYVSGTWTPDGGTGRVYSLASFSPAPSALRRVVTLRLESTTGPRLREVQYDQLQAYSGPLFAVTGADEAAVVHTSEDVDESATLYGVLDTWPAELSDGADTPSWLPARLHDLPCLMAAEVRFGSGGEGAMPDELARKLLDRRAQYQQHVGRRSVDVPKLTAPETFVS